MSDARDDLVRERAYAIWEAEGCPDGRQQQHWEQATAELNQVQADAATQDQPMLATLDDAAGVAVVPASAADAVTPPASTAEANATPASGASPAATKPAAASRKGSGGTTTPRGRRRKGD